MSVWPQVAIKVFLYGLLSLSSFCVWSVHPAEGMGEMEHPSMPIPEGVLTPAVEFDIFADSMDGYNLILETENFNIVAPTSGIPDSIETSLGSVLQGHVHLYINGQKQMRVYGKAVHIPETWLKPGVNSLTLSVNNHQHGTFMVEGKEIQSTVIIDTNDNSGWVKSRYQWPN